MISLNTEIRPRSFKQNNPQKEISFNWCSPKRREIFLFIITVASHIRFSLRMFMLELYQKSDTQGRVVIWVGGNIWFYISTQHTYIATHTPVYVYTFWAAESLLIFFFKDWQTWKRLVFIVFYLARWSHKHTAYTLFISLRWWWKWVVGATANTDRWYKVEALSKE